MIGGAKHRTRRALRAAYGRLGTACARLARRPGVATWTILAGHEVGASTPHLPDDMRIAPDHFLRQVAFWAQRAEILDVEAARERVASAPSPGRGIVSFTFDDGYRGLAETLAPMLRTLRLRANVYLHTGTWDGAFLPWTDLYFLLRARLGSAELARRLGLSPAAGRWTSYALKVALKLRWPEHERMERLRRLFRSELGEPGSWAARIYLRPEELRPLEDVLVFGSHTVTHPSLAGLPAEERRRELVTSRRDLEAVLGHPVRTFAFPFGRERDVPAGATSELADAGYEIGLTMREGTNPVPLADLRTLRRWPLEPRFRRWELEALRRGGLEARWLRR